MVATTEDGILKQENKANCVNKYCFFDYSYDQWCKATPFGRLQLWVARVVWRFRNERDRIENNNNSTSIIIFKLNQIPVNLCSVLDPYLGIQLNPDPDPAKKSQSGSGSRRPWIRIRIQARYFLTLPEKNCNCKIFSSKDVNWKIECFKTHWKVNLCCNYFKNYPKPLDPDSESGSRRPLILWLVFWPKQGFGSATLVLTAFTKYW